MPSARCAPGCCALPKIWPTIDAARCAAISPRSVAGDKPRPLANSSIQGGEPAIQQAAHEQAESTWRAVRQLPPRDQEVIYLRYFLELSVAEVAQVLGVAEGTVKSRTHRALGRLRTVIEADFPELP